MTSTEDNDGEFFQNNQRYPHHLAGHNESDKRELIDSYVASKEIFYCPSVTPVNSENGFAYEEFASNKIYYSTYNIWAGYSAENYSDINYHNRAKQEYEFPKTMKDLRPKTILIGDLAYSNPETDGSNYLQAGYVAHKGQFKGAYQIKSNGSAVWKNVNEMETKLTRKNLFNTKEIFYFW
ncbi:MAG: hypothetical protein HRT89_13885 [Lentisphaeria bacterium]|nr:hypothetical protein [Lentisphaeria bacterium]